MTDFQCALCGAPSTLHDLLPPLGCLLITLSDLRRLRAEIDEMDATLTRLLIAATKGTKDAE
jgi:hypothetical protein